MPVRSKSWGCVKPNSLRFARKRCPNLTFSAEGPEILSPRINGL